MGYVALQTAGRKTNSGDGAEIQAPPPIVTFPQAFDVTTLRMQKLRSPSVESPELTIVLPLKSGAGQNIDTHVSPTKGISSLSKIEHWRLSCSRFPFVCMLDIFVVSFLCFVFLSFFTIYSLHFLTEISLNS